MHKYNKLYKKTLVMKNFGPIDVNKKFKYMYQYVRRLLVKFNKKLKVTTNERTDIVNYP